jgi:hypothetical protein
MTVQSLGRLLEAAADFRRAQQLDPDNPALRAIPNGRYVELCLAGEEGHF